ncbi:TerD family protein, partial [Nocardia elegans]|uniref:TerD family protein n=1 Tax=Nocardia elegans TaxID=300029 RepID=UPI001E45C262
MSATLAKGQNGPLNTADVVISVQLTAPADLSALLVTERGKVRSDADFVFYNQPSGPGVQLVPGPAGQAASLAVSLNAVPADIDQIRAVITLDDPSASFGRFAPPTAIVSDAAGARLYEYRIDGLDRESIVIALELYRRQGAWKVRAVGQGYAGGFAALVTDHGVNVDDSPPPAAQQAPPPPPVYENNLDGWIRQALDIMAANGIPGSYEGIYRNIMRESTGNPQAINLWDSNAAAGIPSKGLLQVIDPTFAAYHVPGTAFDVWDP